MPTIDHPNPGFGAMSSVAPNDVIWNEIKSENDSFTSEVYQRVSPGVELGHVHLAPGPGIQYASKVDVHIGDLVYLTNALLRDKLNKYIVKSGFGPFDYISQASLLLRTLEKKNPTKAAEFLGYLREFAEGEGFNVEMFHQWPHVLDAKDRRDLMSHPLKLGRETLAYLQSLVDDGAGCISTHKEAVCVLIAAAKECGLV